MTRSYQERRKALGTWLLLLVILDKQVYIVNLTTTLKDAKFTSMKSTCSNQLRTSGFGSGKLHLSMKKLQSLSTCELGDVVRFCYSPFETMCSMNALHHSFSYA